MLKSVKLLDNKPSEWLAHRFYVLGQFDMCLNVVEQILRKTPDNSEALSLKGSVLRTKGQIDEALNCFQSAYNFDPENPRHMLEIAKCLYFLGRYPQSLRILGDFDRSEEGNSWEVCHLIGCNNLKLKKYEEAVDAFQEALDADYRLETVLELWKCYEGMRDIDELKNLITEASKYHGQNAQFKSRLGKLHVQLKHYEHALKDLRVAYTKDPRDFQSILYAGSVEQENQRTDNALVLYRKAFPGLSNSPALWNNVALCIQARSRREAVITCCKRAMFFAPFESLPLANMGLVYLEMGMYCSAAIALKRAKALDPANHSVIVGLAVALMNVGEYNEARAIMKSHMQKNKTHDLLINYALCLYQTGEMEEAKQIFDEFMEMVSEEPVLESLYPVRSVLVPMFGGVKETKTPMIA